MAAFVLFVQLGTVEAAGNTPLVSADITTLSNGKDPSVLFDGNLQTNVGDVTITIRFKGPTVVASYMVNSPAGKTGNYRIQLFNGATNVLDVNAPVGTAVRSAGNRTVTSVTIYSLLDGPHDFSELQMYGDPYVPPVVKPILTGSSITHNSILLKWNDLKPPYTLTQDGVTVSSSIGGSQYQVMNLQPFTSYVFQVSYVDAYGRTGTSDPFTVKTLPPPDPVKPVLKASYLSFNSLLLRWDDLKSPYTLIQNGQPISTSILSNEYDFAGSLNPDSDYIFEVSYIDQYGRVVKSDPLLIRTPSIPQPVKPTLKAYNVTFNSLDLQWDNLNPPYTVYKDNVLVSDSVATNKYQFVSGDLIPNTSYVFKVAYTDVLGRLIVSDSLTVKTSSIPPVQVPIVTLLLVTNDAARFSWTVSGDNYRLILDGVEVGQTKSLSYNKYDLNEKTSHTFKVIAIDQFGRQTSSNVISFTTLANPPPPDPPGPSVPPPEVSHSGNTDLDHANDQLVQGAQDTKTNFVSMLWIIIAIFILIFGSWFLVKVFKAKAMKSTQAKSGGASSIASNARVSTAGAAARPRSSGNYKSNIAQKSTGRKKYYVEKNYWSSKTKR